MTDYQTIGGLREALRAFAPAAACYIDNRPPTALSSYRGHYDHLAIERNGCRHESTSLSGRGRPFEVNVAGYGIYAPGNDEVRIKADPTVADLIEALDLADGEVFEGYKGGQFTMHDHTDLWVSEYGQFDQRRIVAAEAFPWRVNLITQEEE